MHIAPHVIQQYLFPSGQLESLSVSSSLKISSFSFPAFFRINRVGGCFLIFNRAFRYLEMIWFAHFAILFWFVKRYRAQNFRYNSFEQFSILGRNAGNFGFLWISKVCFSSCAGSLKNRRKQMLHCEIVEPEWDFLIWVSNGFLFTRHDFY